MLGSCDLCGKREISVSSSEAREDTGVTVSIPSHTGKDLCAAYVVCHACNVVRSEETEQQRDERVRHLLRKKRTNARQELVEQLVELCTTLERSNLKWDRIADLARRIKNTPQ